MKFSLMREYLKNILGDEYVVTNERNLEYDPDKINVVLNMLAGTEFDDVLAIPFQIYAFADDIDDTQDKLNTFVANYNRKTWQSGDNYIRNEFTQAQCVDKNVTGLSINSAVEFFIGGSFLIYSNIVRLETLTIDGEEHKVFNYNLTSSPAIDSANEFNGDGDGAYSLKSTGGFTSSLETLVLYSKDTTFLNTCLNTHFGNNDSTTAFEMVFTFTNGLTFTRNMIVTSYANATESNNDIPKIQLGITPASSLLS